MFIFVTFLKVPCNKAVLWETLFWYMLHRARLTNACVHITIVLCYLGNIQEDLVPPSHFASSVRSAAVHRGVQNSGTPPPIPWLNPGVTSVTLPSGDPGTANPWLAITQAQQEILELRKENQRIMMLQGDSTKGRMPVDDLSDLRARYPTICLIWSEIPLLSLSWVARWVGYMNCSSSSNTDVQREVYSGPDGSQSGAWRQRSTRLKLRG